MRKAIAIGIFFIMMIISSCSVHRFLPEGERLYKGTEVTIQKHPETAGTARSLRKTIQLAASPKPNKFLFGQPWKVWWWYVLGEPKREKGLKSFLRNRLGEPPVLSSRVNAKATAENMESLMENLGYFHTTVQGDTMNVRGYFTKAIYTAQVQPQYHIDKIEWVNDSSSLMRILEQNSASSEGLLKTGNVYRLSDITAERDRLDLLLKTRGYYYFNPDYLMVYADSTVGGRKVNLVLNIKKTTPEDAKHAYRIKDIFVYPRYSLDSARVDTVKRAFTVYDSLKIRTSRRFDNSLFARMITYRPGRLYSSRQQNTTLNRLINLPAFKFVKNRFEPAKDSLRDSGRYFLNAYYYLTPAKRNSIQAELDAFTKENNFLGTQVSLNYKTRNAFKGAEQLGVKVYGAVETTSGAAVKNNNFRLGTELTFKVPKYVTAFFRIKENLFYPPNTNFLLGYEYLKKDIFYTKNLFRFSFDATWKPNVQKQYTLSPVALSYLQASQITDSFRKEALLNPALLYTVNSEAILGSYASYTYNSNFRTKKNKVYFNAGIDLSGNIAGLLTGARSYRSKSVFGVPFAQYVKVDADYHYTRTLTNGYDWASRLLIGVGIPYNNSNVLPITKLYTIGGSNSIRGFRSRTLGPGSYKPTPKDQRIFQVIGGDYKLLANTELRIPFSKTLSGAVFLDAGNIWTKDTVLFGPQGKFTKDFLKEIAVATGIGIRFDATVLLIRADLGTPLRKPYLTGNRWVSDFNFGSRAWRRENLILNIAIGLPF